MKIERLGVSSIEAFNPLISAYAFKPYRNYRVLSQREQENVLRAEVREALESRNGGAVLATADGQAGSIFHELTWDSAFFGIPMGRILYVLHSESAGRTEVEAAVAAGLQACREAGLKHVAARVDVADAVTIGALEDHGFRLMDALVTYIYHPKREPPPPVKEMGVLRPYRDEDAAQIVEIAKEAYRGFRSRFHFDSHLPDERCDELYVEWARKVCAKDMPQEVLVTENGQGQLHGFTSFRRIEPVSTVGGVEMSGRGLGACRKDRPGAYMGLLRAATAQIHARGGVAEAQTQNYNYSTVRVYESFGGQYVRAEYTFHAWLGP